MYLFTQNEAPRLSQFKIYNLNRQIDTDTYVQKNVTEIITYPHKTTLSINLL